MSTLEQRFAELQAERPEITQADLARATGAKPPSVNAWFKGDTKSMKPGTAAKAAALYGIDPLWLATGEGYKIPRKITSNQPLALIDNAQAAINNVATLAQITQALSTYFEAMDGSTKDITLDLLARLAKDPQDHARIAAMIELSIHSKRQKVA